MSILLENELRTLLVTRLELSGVKPEDIDAEAPLFDGAGGHGGLGLDSIDALELAAALEEQYAVKIAAGSKENPVIFRSVRSLAAFVETHRAR